MNYPNAQTRIDQRLRERAEWDDATVSKLIAKTIKPLGYTVAETFGPTGNHTHVQRWPGLRAASASAATQAMSEVVYVGVVLDLEGAPAGSVWPKLKQKASALKKKAKLKWITSTSYEEQDFPLHLTYYAPLDEKDNPITTLGADTPLHRVILLFALIRGRSG